MDGHRRLRWYALVWSALVVGQAGCNFLPRSQPQLLGPAILPAAPTLEQIVQAVNRNSGQIQSFSSNQAALSGPGFPTLRATVAFQRPLDFRLRADTAFTGGELDLGSNRDLFWIWVRRNQPPALYYCRHDQFATSAARRMIPIEPTLLIEALGVMEFDPALPHQGPFPTRNGNLQIHTLRETPEGTSTKITVVDRQRAIVLGQYVYDHRRQLTASAVASQHRRDPVTGVIMPQIVEVACPAAQFSLRVDLGNATINQLSGDPVQLFSMPNYEGYAAVDLCNPGFQVPQYSAPAPRSSPAPAPAATSSTRRSIFSWGRALR